MYTSEARGRQRRWVTCSACGAKLKQEGTRLEDHVKKHVIEEHRQCTGQRLDPSMLQVEVGAKGPGRGP